MEIQHSTTDGCLVVALAGSIETLKKIVEINQGITILPALALKDMTARQQKNVRFFKDPAPVREIGLVTYRYYVKEKLVRGDASPITYSAPPSAAIAAEDRVISALPLGVKDADVTILPIDRVL